MAAAASRFGRQMRRQIHFHALFLMTNSIRPGVDGVAAASGTTASISRTGVGSGRAPSASASRSADRTSAGSRRLDQPLPEIDVVIERARILLKEICRTGGQHDDRRRARRSLFPISRGFLASRYLQRLLLLRRQGQGPVRFPQRIIGLIEASYERPSKKLPVIPPCFLLLLIVLVRHCRLSSYLIRILRICERDPQTRPAPWRTWWITSASGRPATGRVG